MNILIAGASGSVGEGLVEAFLEKGHYVTAVIRNEDKRIKLEEYLLHHTLQNFSTLNVIINAFDNEQNTISLTEEISSKQWDLVIASLGGWYHGDVLHKIPLTDWNSVIQNGLTSHFLFAKAVIPVLEKQQNSTYVMINGGASEFAVPHSGAISIVAAAQKMMSQVLATELKHTAVRVHAVAAFDMVKTRQREKEENIWLTPAKIAEYILTITMNPKVTKLWHKIAKPEDLLI